MAPAAPWSTAKGITASAGPINLAAHIDGMTTAPSRVPAGVRTGGQFAATQHAESVDLVDPNAKAFRDARVTALNGMRNSPLEHTTADLAWLPNGNLAAISLDREGKEILVDLGPSADPYQEFINPKTGRLDLRAVRAWAAENVSPTDRELATEIDRSDLPEWEKGNLKEALARCTTQDGKRLFINARNSAYGLSPSQSSELAGRGFDHVSYQKALDSGISRQALISKDIGPERADRIARLGLSRMFSERGWYQDGIAVADYATLDQVGDPNNGWSSTDRYRALAAAISPEHGARVDEAIAHGLTERSLIEATEHPVHVLAGLRRAARRRKPWEIRNLADMGHDYDSVKNWGLRLADQFVRDELESTGADPKQLRAVLPVVANDGKPLDAAMSYISHGFTSAAEIGTWEEALIYTAGRYPAAELAAIRETGVSPSHLRSYVRAVPIYDRITPATARRVKALAAQHSDPMDFQEKAKLVVDRPSEWRADRLGALEQLAKMTPDEIRAAIASGQPLATLSEYRSEVRA